MGLMNIEWIWSAKWDKTRLTYTTSVIVPRVQKRVQQSRPPNACAASNAQTRRVNPLYPIVQIITFPLNDDNRAYLHGFCVLISLYGYIIINISYL